MTSLDVHEISVVDRPAIRRPFLVVKRDDSSPTPTDAGEQEILALYKRDGFEHVQLQAPQPKEIATAIGIAVPMLRRMAERMSAGEEQNALSRVAGLLAQLQGGSMALPVAEDNKPVVPPAPKPAAKPPITPPPGAPPGADHGPEFYVDEAKNLKMKLEKALEEKEKAMADLEALKAGKEKKQKAEGGDGDEPFAYLTSNGLVPVAKGMKMLTKDREQMMKDAATHTLKAFKEMAGEEKCKAIFADVLGSGLKDLPDDPQVPQMVNPTGEGKPIMKSEDAIVEAVLKRLQPTMEKIEKAFDAKPASQSGAGEPVPVKKAASIWGNILGT